MNNGSPEHTIPEKLVRAGLRANITAAAFGIVAPALIQGLPLIMLLEALGASGVLIGMIAMLNQAAMLVQIPAALLAERLAERKRFWVATVFVSRALWIVPVLLLGMHAAAGVVITSSLVVVGLSAILVQSSSASWWSWMADLLPDHLRSRFWSIRQGICTAVMIATFGLAGWLLDLFPKDDYTGFILLLSAGIVAGCLEPLIHLRVPEPPAHPAPSGIPLTTRLRQPLCDPNFRAFTLIMCIWFFGLGLIGPFTMVYLKQVFQALYTHLSLIQMAGLVGSMVTCFYASKLINQTGLRTFGILMLLLSPLFHAVWFFLSATPVPLPALLGGESVPFYVILLILNSLAAGSVYAAFGIYQLNMLTSIVPREGRTLAMAIHWFMIGCASACAPLLTGLIKDWMELHPSGLMFPNQQEFSYLHAMLLLHALLIWGVAIPLTKKLKGVETDLSLTGALTHIFITNPLRMARDVYGFNGAVIASAGRASAKAAWTLGVARDKLQNLSTGLGRKNNTPE